MELMELLKMLVETEDKMARMEIVEQNPIDQSVPDEGSVAEVDNSLVESLQAEIETLKQKYIDTFFNGGKETEPEKTEEPKKEKSIEEIVGGN